MNKRTKKILASVLLAALALLFLLTLLLVRVTVTTTRTLVGPEGAMALLEQGAPLDEIADAAIRSGESVDDIQYFGGTLLIRAVDKRRLDVVGWALSRGANPNGVSASVIPLEHAIRKNEPEMVGMLLAKGADPDRDIGYGLTPRKLAQIEGNTQILAMFSGHGTTSRAADTAPSP